MPAYLCFLYTIPVFFLVLVYSIYGHAIGAPCAAQHTLHPSSTYHGESHDLKASPPPYRFSITDQDDLEVRTYVPGQQYTIRVFSKDGAHFRGFIIQGRVATKDGSLVGVVRAGRFIYDQERFDLYGIQFQECAPYNNDSITQLNSTLKYFLEVQWIADKNYGPVQFVLTMVQEQNDFWETWRPESGFLLLGTASNHVVKNRLNGTKATTPILPVEGNDDLLQIRALSEKLELHQAKKPQAQTDLFFNDQADADDEDSDGATTPASKPKSKTKSHDPLTTAAPPDEVDEGEPDQKNQTASGEKSSGSVRAPTPKPPVEATTTEEAEEEEEETSTTKSQKSKSPASATTRISTPGDLDASNEEINNETESGAELQPQVPMAVTKPPFKIPLSSLNRLRDLFKQAQKRRNKTITAEEIAKSMPTPPPFPLKKIVPSTPSGDEVSEDETERPTTQAPTTQHPKATYAASNRLDFPTLAPFPTSPPQKGQKRVNASKEMPPTTPMAESEENESEESTKSSPKKGAKGPQPALRLIKGATVAPDAESEEKESNEKSMPKPGKSNSNNSKIVATTEPSGDEEEEETEEPVTERTTKPSHRPKVGSPKSGSSHPSGSDGTPPPAALVLRDQGMDESSNSSVEATTRSNLMRKKGKGKNKPSKTKSTFSTTMSTLAPAALVLNDEENEDVVATTTVPANKSNVAFPERRRIAIGNSTIEEENDAEFLKEQDYCGSNPCLNKGKCINLASQGRFKCKCSEGWTGTICDKRDFCVSDACQNGGLCVTNEFGYTCNCTGLWVGKHCEKKCAASLCKNGGTCASDDSNGFVCLCRPGYTGSQCEVDIDDCANNPCKNGATCQDKVNGYFCTCKDGYMGETCHRPCQDIYKSCETWGEEGRCETTRQNTHWFDINCAVTCGKCVFVNSTVNTLVPLPPVLEPFQFLMGKWSVNATHLHRFPIDFVHGNAGYYEEIEFSPVNVPMFGTPSINYTAVSRNNQFPTDAIVTHGFMTLKPSISPTLVALMSTSNDGITIIEEGTIPSDGTLDMKANYIAVVPPVAHKVPVVAKRQFTIYSGFLRETVERSIDNQTTEFFTKYFYKDKDYVIY